MKQIQEYIATHKLFSLALVFLALALIAFIPLSLAVLLFLTGMVMLIVDHGKGQLHIEKEPTETE